MEPCAIVCPVACANCPTVNCADRLAGENK